MKLLKSKSCFRDEGGSKHWLASSSRSAGIRSLSLRCSFRFAFCSPQKSVIFFYYLKAITIRTSSLLRSNGNSFLRLSPSSFLLLLCSTSSKGREPFLSCIIYFCEKEEAQRSLQKLVLVKLRVLSLKEKEQCGA